MHFGEYYIAYFDVLGCKFKYPKGNVGIGLHEYGK